MNLPMHSSAFTKGDFFIEKLTDLIKKTYVVTGKKEGDYILPEEMKTPKRYIANLERKWLLRDPDTEFREGTGQMSKRHIMVPLSDKWIVLGFLLAAMGDPPTPQKDDFGNPIIRKWLAGKLDKELEKDPRKILELWDVIQGIIWRTYELGKTDEPTAQEWVNVLSSMLGVQVAHYEIKLREILEDFKDLFPASDLGCVDPGRIIVEKDGERFFSMPHTKQEVDIEGKTIDEIVEDLSTNAGGSDYMEALLKIAQKLHEGARKKAERNLGTLVEMKNLITSINPDIKKMRDTLDESYDHRVGTDDDGNPVFEHVEVEPTTMADGYLVFYQHAHDYLERHTDVLKAMAEKNGNAPEEILEWLDCRTKKEG